MMGSFLSRGLLMVFGYAYPAYKCFKIVEKDEPQVEHLLFWCQYWILVAFASVCERLGDTFVSWLPLYGEAKLAFFIYLWHRKTKGTKYMYNYFCRNFLKKHEAAIDRNLLELRNKAGDLTVVSWQQASKYGLTRFFDTLQNASSQSQSLQWNDHVFATKEHQSDDGRQLEQEYQMKPLASFGDDGKAPVTTGHHVSKYSYPRLAKESDANITLRGKQLSPQNDELKGSPANGEDRKTGVFRAAMNRLRSRKSPDQGK